jgi:hypothetical protein
MAVAIPRGLNDMVDLRKYDGFILKEKPPGK